MCNDAETDLARLAVISSGPKGRAEVPLEHAEGCFDLPPLAVELLGESPLHQASVIAVHRFALSVLPGPSALRRRDNAANAQVVPADAVEPFGLVARIAQQRLEPLLPQRRQQRGLVLDAVDLGAPVDHSAKDQVIGRVADGRDLRKSMLVVERARFRRAALPDRRNYPAPRQ